MKKTPFYKFVFQSSVQVKKRKVGPEMKCEHCDKSFIYRAHMVKHAMKAHGIQMNIKQERVEAEQEEASDSSFDAITDSSFDVSFPGEDSSMDESSYHGNGVNEDKQLFSCDLCPKTFSQEMRFTNHKRRMHGNGIEESKKFPCGYVGCTKIFFSKQGLGYHLKNKHDGKEGTAAEDSTTEKPNESPEAAPVELGNPKEFVCSFACGKSYKTRQTLAEHEIKVHKRSPKKKGARSRSKSAAQPSGSCFQFSSGEEKEDKEEEDKEEPVEGVARMEEESKVRAEELEALRRKYDLAEVNPSSEDGPEEEEDVSMPQEAEKEDVSKSEEAEEEEGHEGPVDQPPVGPGPWVYPSLPPPAVAPPVEELRPQEQEEPATTEEEEALFVAHLQETKETALEEEQPVLPPFIEEQEEKKEEKKAAGAGLNLADSAYFTKNPKAIANPQERSVKLFSEAAVGLPEGWKVRNILDPKDQSKAVKHFLSPDIR